MAKRDKNTLYGWAIPRWKPLAVQIKDWFDSYWHKDDGIPVASVTGLQNILNNLPDSNTVQLLFESINGVQVDFNADGAYVIPGGKTLIEILVKPEADINFKMGSAAGLDDIVPEQPVAAADPQVITLKLYANGNRTVYIGGITTATTIIFYKR